MKKISNFYISDSKISGKGTFASRDIEQDSVVGLAFVKVSNTGVDDKDYKRTKLGTFTNHSKTPNLYIKKIFNKKRQECIVFYSKVPIKKDTELTVDYTTFEWEGKRDFAESRKRIRIPIIREQAEDFIKDGLFKRIKNIFKTKFNWNVDYMKLAYSSIPLYDNNKPNYKMPIEEFGACHTKRPYNIIYLSTTLEKTIAYYNIDMTKIEFAGLLIAHELAHEVHLYLLTPEQREKYYSKIPEDFYTSYLDHVKKDQPNKFNEERFCEYIAHLVYTYLKQNNLMLESTNSFRDILYHGSSVQNLKVLKPRLVSTSDKQRIARVFATDNKMVALMFICKPGTPLSIGFVNGVWYIKEKGPNAFEGYNIFGSIYTVNGTGFVKLNSSFDEYVSLNSVKVINEEKYDNIWKELVKLEKSNQIKLIRYGDTTHDDIESYNNLYHISPINLNGQILIPRIPVNFLTRNGFEEDATPRISFCPSISGCLTAISKNLKNMVFNVYIIDESYSTPQIRHVTNREVPDQSLTGEVWVLNPVKLKWVTRIKVIKATDELTYTYGNHVGKTYRWKYREI